MLIYKDTAILVVIFNRPDFSFLLYKQLESLKPSKLYIVSDGARNEPEKLIVEESRSIFNSISWECDVKYNYAAENIGLKNRIISGIDWAFESEDQLIILEDDCIPHPDFFPFCEAMLTKYKNVEKVMSINGCNLYQTIPINNSESYIFSRYANSWGWATWRDSWKRLDRNLAGLDDPEINAKFDLVLPSGLRARLYWKYIFKQVRAEHIKSWAFRWIFTLFMNNSLAIVPRTNLISNIGIDSRSTNTRGELHFINLETAGLLSSEIIDPTCLEADYNYDKWVEDTIYSKSVKYRFIWLLKKIKFYSFPDKRNGIY